MTGNIIKSYSFSELSVGMSESYNRTLTEQDIEDFARLSGDNNPMHMDDNYAKTTPFQRRIAHGLLTSSLLSTIIGTKLPGAGCIYVSQSLIFKAPVFIGDTVTAKATITKLIPEKHRVILQTECIVNDIVVLDGEAVVQVIG